MSLEYSRGDLIDRYSIETRRLEYGADNAKEVGALAFEIAKINWTSHDLLNAIIIAEANASISVLEWQIRADHKLSDEEVGIRAREIRRINGRRVAAKNAIDDKFSTFTPGFDIPLDKINLAVPNMAK